MKTKNLPLILSLLGIISSANAAIVSIDNASLETNALSLVDNSTSWVQPASGWFTYATATAAIGVATNSDGFWNISGTDGSRSGYVTSTAADGGGSIYQNVALDPGSYRMTIAVASSTGAPKQDGLFSLNVYDSGANRNGLAFVAESAIQSVVYGTAFTDYTLDFTITSSSNYAVGFRNRGFVADSQPGNPAESTVFFDNVRLETIPEPGSLSLLGVAAALGFIRRRR